jgi:hypothetical protein
MQVLKEIDASTSNVDVENEIGCNISFDTIVFKVPGEHSITKKKCQVAMLDHTGLSTTLIVLDVSVSK